MYKGTIYSLALFYQNVITSTGIDDKGNAIKRRLNISEIRYYRDCFKSILELGEIIERDRQAIIAEAKNKFPKWNEDKISEEKANKFIKENIDKLNAEEYAPKFDFDIDSLEKSGIKIDDAQLALLELSITKPKDKEKSKKKSTPSE